MNAHDAIAVQSLIGRVHDLGGLTWVANDGGETVLQPEFYVWRALAKGTVAAFAVEMRTGQTTPMPSEVFMGATEFVFDLVSGGLLFTQQHDPFGGRWTPRTLSDVREQYERWQFRHELDEDWTPLRRWFDEEIGLDVSSLRLRLEFPLYVLAIGEPEAAEERVRREQAAVLGRPSTGLATTEVEPLAISTLTSKQVAAILQIEEQSLRRWRSQGKGPPFVKLGGQKIVYLEESLRAWMRAREVNR